MPHASAIKSDDSSFWSPADATLPIPTPDFGASPQGTSVGNPPLVHLTLVGKTEEVGSAEQVMSRIKDNPNGYFVPKMRVDGSLKKEGDVGYLRPPESLTIGSGNPVTVLSTNANTILLEMKPGRRFQGTAEHSTFEKGGYTYYRVARAKGVKQMVAEWEQRQFATVRKK